MKNLSWLLLFYIFAVSAKIPQAVKQEIDLRIKHSINPSIVIGVFENGQTDFYTQGYQDADQTIPVDKQSVYEIGSITKTYTGLLLAQMIQAGKLKLDSPVQDQWPNPFRLLDSENNPITVKQLATHSSGLPRLPPNLAAFSPDPYAQYDREKLLAGLDTIKSGQAGVNYVYSNLAVGLLGETLANVSNQPYNQMVTKNILKPLDLKETYMQFSDVPAAHLVQGFQNNSPGPAWTFKALAAAGSIRSSITDLLHYGMAHLAPQNKTLVDAMKLATTSHYQQGDVKVGLGWHINSEGIIWHNGGTGGFMSILMIDPEQQKVVAGITNTNQHSVEDIAAHLMSGSYPMQDYEFPVDIDAASLSQYEGDYVLDGNLKSLGITLRDEKLYFTAPLQPKQALTFIGDDTFKFKMIKVKLKFKRNEQQQISAVQLQGWGEPQTYIKQH